jgi:predicted RNA binding protein YcfA (HicA-like mRNA interferase family)
MTKRQKRLERIRQNPKAVSFQDLRQLLEDYGFKMRRISGSHYIFRAPLGNTLGS